MNNDNSYPRRLVNITLSLDQYVAVMNTKCQGAKLLLDLGFRPKLSHNGRNIYYEAQGTEDDAVAVYDWADFCCP